MNLEKSIKKALHKPSEISAKTLSPIPRLGHAPWKVLGRLLPHPRQVGTTEENGKARIQGPDGVFVSRVPLRFETREGTPPTLPPTLVSALTKWKFAL